MVKNKLTQIASSGSKISLIALFAFPLCPLPVANIIFILFSAFTLLSWLLNGCPPFWKNLKLNFIIAIPFIPYLVEWFFYFNNPVMGFEVEKKMLFFIAPIIFALYYSVSKPLKLEVYMKVFTTSVMVVSTYTLILLITNNILFSPDSYAGDSSVLRLKFEDISGLHPTYFGLFASISILWILYDYRNLSQPYKWIAVFFFSILLFLDFLVAAKMSLIILVLGSFFLLYKIMPGKKYLLLTYIVIAAFLASLLVLIPSVRERVFEMKGLVNQGDWVYNSIYERKVIFSCSMDVFLQHPWYGIGCRNAQFALDICYRAINFFPGWHTNYNSHNQFLTLGINYGVFDVLFFAGSLLYLIIKVRRNAFFTLILISTVLIMLTESILERQMGVYFYVVFILLIYNHNKAEEIKMTDK